MQLDLYFHPKIYKDGQRPVMLRLTIGSKSYYKVLFRLAPEDWESDRKLVRKGGEAARYQNSIIMQELSEANLRLVEVRAGSGLITMNSDRDRMVNFILGKSDEHARAHLLDETIMQLVKRYLKTREDEIKYRTFKGLESKLLSIIPVIKNIKVRELQKADVIRAIDYLKEQGNTGNTIHTKLKKLNEVLGWAEEEYRAKLTHKKLAVKREKVYSDTLEIDELEKLQLVDIRKGTRKFDAKNVFLTQFYLHGSRISDVLLLEKSSVKKKTVEIIQRKTGNKVIVARHQKLDMILENYMDTDGQFVFSFMEGLNINDKLFKIALSTKELKAIPEDIREKVKALRKKIDHRLDSSSSIVRKHLKTIVEEAELEKKVGSHTARRSFATIGDRMSIPISQLSAALGHSTINQTQDYIKRYNFQEISDAVSVVYRGEAPKGEDPEKSK